MAEDLSENEEVVEITDLSDPNVITKYKEAAAIANKTIVGLTGFSKPGTKIVTACGFGDTLIMKQCETVFKSKKIEKGIAFPTCISVNDIVCHYSPLASDSADVVFKAGDIVKIDLGVYIDGYIAVAAKSFICKGEEESDTPAVKGKLADVFMAAHVALEGCTKLIKPGNKNTEVTGFIKSVADCYGVQPVQGVLMHQLKRYVIDGNEVIINREEPEHKVEDFAFEKNKVYTIDIFYSTGQGKPIETSHRTTVFKRAIDQNYNLKMKASRQLFKKIQTSCGTLPFTLRSLSDDEKVGRLGIVECSNHGLVHPYPVLVEKPVTSGEPAFVVHLKATVMTLPSGTVRITSVDSLEEIRKWCNSEKENSEEIIEVLSRSAKNKKKKKKKKQAEA